MPGTSGDEAAPDDDALFRPRPRPSPGPPPPAPEPAPLESPAVPPRRRRRVVPWAAGIAGVLLVAGGATLAAVGYADTSGPDGAVAGYFAALQRGDAGDALAFGDLPDESRVLLSDAVLDEQRRIAPIEKFQVLDTDRTGPRARVSVRYTLAFPAAPQTVDATVTVREVDGDWRLTRAAVPTELQLAQAAQRATVLGRRVPDGTVLVFPGAVPIRFDTGYLRLKATDASVSFDSGATTQVYVEASSAGRRAALAATEQLLRRCLTGRGDLTCPQPTERFVPGSLRGTISRFADNLIIDAGAADAGTLEVRGEVLVTRGSYRVLGFDNRETRTTASFRLPVRAVGYAVAPLRMRWGRPS